MSLLFAGLAALGFGVSDYIGGVTSRRAPAMTVILWSYVLQAVILAVAVPLTSGSFPARGAGFGVAAGVGGVVGLVFLYRGLAEGRMAVVAPVSAVVGAALPVAVGMGLGERPGAAAVAGMVLALPAVWLVSAVAGTETGPTGVGFGVAAGAGFALFSVMIGRAPAEAGLWPLGVSRAVSLGLLLAVLALGRLDRHLPAAARPGVAAVAVGEVASNVAFIAAVRTGLLSLAAVVTSLYPVVTVLLARLVLAEPMRPRQWTGLGLAVAALTLIAT